MDILQSLPRAAAGHNAPEERTPPPSAVPPGEPVNVLIVDDQPANLMLLEAILGDLPLNLVKAESGEQA